MGEWIRKNPVLCVFINLGLSLIILLFAIRLYVNYKIDNDVDGLIDDKIINEYQQPIVEKLDILIELYNDE